MTAATMIAALDPPSSVKPNSLNVYTAAMSESEAMTITSARTIVQPFHQPSPGPSARMLHANVVPASGSALFRYL